MEEDRLNTLEAEKKELRLLINQGISFNVRYKETRTERRRVSKYLPSWITRKVEVTEDDVKEFVIKEPTAYTLDRLSAEYIELQMDEQRIHDNPRQEARKLYMQHSKRMSLIVAIAILGNDWEDDKKLNELADFLHRWIKPSEIHDLVQAIDLTNNLADFINSMRLMSSARTTMPNRIETED